MKSENIYTPNPTASYPPSLICNDHWSLMKLAWSEPKQKFLKTPIDIITGFPANSDEMNVSFSTASQHLNANTVLNYRHPDCAHRLGLIDCDGCIAPDGSVSLLVQSLLKYMDTYAEFSVTNGVHLLCWLDDVPPDGHKDREWNVEFYWRSRSIPITGNRVVLSDWSSPDDVQPRTENLLKLHKARFTDAWLPPAPAQNPAYHSCVLSRDEILSRLFGEREGKKWADIYAGNWQGHYGSPSDADLALLMKFAFYTGKDRHIMETLFSECPLSSILIRGTFHEPSAWRIPKWANKSYRKKTLDAAITRTTAVYTPRTKAMSAQEFYTLGRRRLS